MYMNNSKNLTNSFFDGFLVLRKAYTRNKKVYWELECEHCGHCIVRTRSELNLRNHPLECPACHKNDTSLNFNPNNETYKAAEAKKNEENDKYCKQRNNLTFDTSLVNTPLVPSLSKSTKVEDEGTTEPITISGVSYNNFTMTDEVGELFDVPAYYYIAHCIPADLSFGGATAKVINEFWDMKHTLEEYYEGIELEPGDCLFERNIFNLIVSPRKYTKGTYEALQVAVQKMAKMCYNENVRYLAMPRIGCGSNGLSWSDVQAIITKAFANEFEGSDKMIHISVYSYELGSAFYTVK